MKELMLFKIFDNFGPIVTDHKAVKDMKKCQIEAKVAIFDQVACLCVL